jgi:uncharacterized membrane protein YesL
MAALYALLGAIIRALIPALVEAREATRECIEVDSDPVVRAAFWSGEWL